MTALRLIGFRRSNSMRLAICCAYHEPVSRAEIRDVRCPIPKGTIDVLMGGRVGSPSLLDPPDLAGRVLKLGDEPDGNRGKVEKGCDGA